MSSHQGIYGMGAHDEFLKDLSCMFDGELEEQAAAEMLETSREAEKFGTLGAGPKPPARQMFEGVYKEMPLHLQRQLEQIRQGY